MMDKVFLFLTSSKTIVFIAVGGAAGAVSRYLLSGWIHRLFGSAFPFGTLAVNVVGCFLIGVVMHVGQATDLLPESWRLAITIGFLGALTTFSAFGYETMMYAEHGKWSVALGNIGANVAVCLLAVWAGLILARSIVGGA